MSDEPEDLRDLLKQEKQRAAQLEAELEALRPVARKQSLIDAGLNLDNPVHKLLAEVYPSDRELNAEQVQAFATERGIDLTPQPSPEQTRRVESQQKLESIQQTPATGRVHYREWQQQMSNPATRTQAQAAHKAGLVEFPPHLAQQLANNRAS